MTDQSLRDGRTGIRSPTALDGARDGPLERRRPIRSVVDVAHLKAPFEMLGFWSAIALPALYLPLVVAGIDSTGELFVFLALFAAHAIALFVGRSYGRD